MSQRDSLNQLIVERLLDFLAAPSKEPEPETPPDTEEPPETSTLNESSMAAKRATAALLLEFLESEAEEDGEVSATRVRPERSRAPAPTKADKPTVDEPGFRLAIPEHIWRRALTFPVTEVPDEAQRVIRWLQARIPHDA